jgi:hypothetical protein
MEQSITQVKLIPQKRQETISEKGTIKQPESIHCVLVMSQQELAFVSGKCQLARKGRRSEDY